MWIIILVQCSSPEVPDGGVEFEKTIYNFNEEIEFKCQIGYILIGEPKIVCQANGRFSASTILCSLGKRSPIYYKIITDFSSSNLPCASCSWFCSGIFSIILLIWWCIHICLFRRLYSIWNSTSYMWCWWFIWNLWYSV